MKRETGPIVFKRARLEEGTEELKTVNAEMLNHEIDSVKYRSLKRKYDLLKNERDSLSLEVRNLSQE